MRPVQARRTTPPRPAGRSGRAGAGSAQAARKRCASFAIRCAEITWRLAEMRAGRRVSVALATMALGALAVGFTTTAIPALAYPPEQIARGERVWNDVCSECHGPGSTVEDAPLLLTPGSLKSFPH